jgi:hypothetical protein
MKELDSMELLSPRPEIPFTGLSFSGLCNKLKPIKSPTWSTYDPYGYNSRAQHSCDLNNTVTKIVVDAAAAVGGLNISTYSSISSSKSKKA